jgi:hypothetical protein
MLTESEADEFGFLDPRYVNRQNEFSGLDRFSLNGETSDFAFEVDPSPGTGERYINTSSWRIDPLRTHSGTGANVLLRWNTIPAGAQAIDVVVHLHGYIGRPPNEQMLRAVVARGGLDLTGRTRPTLAILPRGRCITSEEVRARQAHLNEIAAQSGAKPKTARSDVYTFPALVRDGGAGLESLVNGALQWLGEQRGGAVPLAIARLILTAHSGGGAALDRLVAFHERRRLCNPEEVHTFDALYAEASGLKSWATARLRAEQSRRNDPVGGPGALRVIYKPEGGTQVWSKQLRRSLPPDNDPLARFYRIDCTRVGHLEIPNQFGPVLLHDRAADLSSMMPCPGATRSPSRAPAISRSPESDRGARPVSVLPTASAHAPLPSDVQAWIHSTERSAIELVPNEQQRRTLLQEINWSQEYFPGNKTPQGARAPGRLAEGLFFAMAQVTPERRVPNGIRYHDTTREVSVVPGQTNHRLFPEARDAFVRMRESAAADGVQLQILSSWRSLARQQAARVSQDNPNAVAPGNSAHMYGLAVDLNMRVPGLQLVNRATRAHDWMANIVRMYRSPIYKWLALNASRFGWFPYRKEPWHWEYNPPGFAARFEASSSNRVRPAGVSHMGSELEFESSEDNALNILSPTELKAVRITSTFETGWPGGFGGLTGNIDGQGLSFGLMNFTIKAGSLIPLLVEFIKKHPDRFWMAFQTDAARFREVVMATKPDPKHPRRRIRDVERQMEFVNNEMNAIPREAKHNTIIEPWATYFGRLENDPEFQKIQVKAVRRGLNHARQWYEYFGFRTERGFAFMFDLVSSHGAAWLNAGKFHGRRIALLQKLLADMQARLGRENLTELEKMEAIANMIADVSSTKWRERVRTRKLWFVRGVGDVHGKTYDIQKGFGITDNAPAFTSETTLNEASETSWEQNEALEMEGPVMQEAAYYGEKLLDFVTKWGTNASPFQILKTYYKLYRPGIDFWRDVAKRVRAGQDLLDRIEQLESGARILKQATDELENAERQLPPYPLQTDDKAGHMLVTKEELDYVERYFNTASLISNNARDAHSALDQEISGWDAVVQQDRNTRDFTRKATSEAVIYLDLRFNNQGGSFRAFLVQARDRAARVEQWAYLKYNHAAHILGKWTAPWYQPPSEPF